MYLNFSFSHVYSFTFSHFKQVHADGTWKEMVSGYPKLGQHNIFAFRFPRFSRYVSYDPTVEMSSVQAVPDSAANSQVGALPIMLVMYGVFKLLL